ncbi:MAG: hypothetical protein V1656_02370 [Candidatus Jorgensenbacteria bacterium]
MESFLGAALGALPAIFFWIVVALAAAHYLAAHLRVPILLPRVPYRALAKCTAIFYPAYATLLTFGQYFVWSSDWWGKQFLNTSLAPSLPIPLIQLFPNFFGSRLGYFLFYSWGRFWLHALLAVGVAALFWWFLRMLKRRNERFFEEGETELGFLCALAAGWPGILPFLVLAFLLVLAVSIARRAIFGEAFTTLGLPFLIAAVAALAFGGALASFFGVSALAV